MCVNSYFVIGVNGVVDLGIDSGFNHELQNSYDGENVRVGRSLLPIAQQWAKLLENPPNKLDISQS